MAESEWYTGIVLEAVPIGEYDRRVVLLTREAGKLSCFGRRARRQGSPLMAAASPFAYGKFRIYRGRSSNVLSDAEIEQYFEGLRSDMTAMMYGSYFLEAAGYVTRENNDETRILLLLYVTLRALERGRMPYSLIRAVYEIRLIVEEGEFEQPSSEELKDKSAGFARAAAFITAAPFEKLYSFEVSDEVLRELIGFAGTRAENYFRHDFKSLSILRECDSELPGK